MANTRAGAATCTPNTCELETGACDIDIAIDCMIMKHNYKLQIIITSTSIDSQRPGQGRVRPYVNIARARHELAS